VSTRVGFIGTSGAFVIPPVYRDVQDFSEGVAGVRLDDRLAFVARDGREVIPERFAEAKWFSEGLASVVEWSPTLAAAATCRARAHALRQKEKSVGYVDRAGEYAIEPAFIYGDWFSEGLAGVEYDVGRWGFVNAAGHTRPVEGCPYAFREGYARFEADDGRQGFLDSDLRV